MAEVENLNAFFDSRVIKTAYCWFWTGSTVNGGYGYLTVESGRRIRAHRYNYERYKGSIPKGAILHHICCHPSCVNPDHLVLSTRGTHPDAAYSKNSAKTCCKRGHEYTPENTYINRLTGARSCKKCRDLAHSVQTGLTKTKLI